jgi:hypothetical protein
MKFFTALFLILGTAVVAKAGEPVSVMAWPNSTYDITQSTIAISSSSVYAFPAVSGYRSVLIDNIANTGTTVYYRVDGSTLSIPTVGWQILPSATEKIETNGVISLQLGADISSVNVRQKTIRK